MALGRLIGRPRRRDPRPAPGVVTAVLLDAFGTLVTLEPPAPLLRGLLAERLGLDVTDAQATAAVVAEVAYYRAHMAEGVDMERTAALHARCAEVLRHALPPDPLLAEATPELMTDLLLDSLRFQVFDEVAGTLARLRGAGLRLVVASNWDASLATVLDRVGLLSLVDGVVASASVGAAKPDPRLLESALLLAGVGAGAAVHVGDGFREDVGAALAAQVRPVLLSRDGSAGAVEYGPEAALLPELLVARSLDELPLLLGF